MEAANDGRGKEEERGKIPSFKTIDLVDLDSAVKSVRDEGKYVYISDMSGKAKTFYTY